KDALDAFIAGSDQLADFAGVQLDIGVPYHLAGGHVDHISRHERAFEIVGGDLDLRNLRLQDLLHQRWSDLLALADNGFAALGDGVRQLQALQAVGDLPEQLLVFDVDLVDAVEGLQYLLVGSQTQRAQKYRAVELALAVDA